MVAAAMGAPRLCLLFPHVALGGGETAMMAVASALERRFDLHIAALDYLPPSPGHTIAGELQQRFRRVTFVRRRWQLRPLLDGMDVVLWYGVTHTIPRTLLALADRPASVRVVHTSRAVDGPAFQRRWRHVIDAVVAVSPQVSRALEGSVFIPNTCSGEHLTGRRERLFPSGPRPTLGFLGRLAPLKNVRWLVENLQRLDCNLVLQALDTELQTAAELEARVCQLGLAGRFRRLAPGRDVGTLLRSIDALVLVSRHEGFPRVVIEAGLIGVPVIATRVGALPEFFADELLFVDSQDGEPVVESFRHALARLSPGRGKQLQRRVHRLCDLETVADRYTEVVQAALASRGASRGATRLVFP